MNCLWRCLLYCLLINTLYAVKIGVSKLTTTTTTTAAPANTTTAGLLSTVSLDASTVTETDAFSPTTTSTFTDYDDTTADDTNLTTSTTTKLPMFYFPGFKPRKTKTSIRTTTLKPSTTTIATTTTTTTTEAVETISAANTTIAESAFGVNHPSRRSAFCACNFLPDSCDVNCCCDPDCSVEALRVFDCFNAPESTELRSSWIDFQYQHGLPSCKTNDGWLCVFRTNIKPDVEKVIPGNYDSSRCHKWPHLLLDEEEDISSDFLVSYKIDEPLKLLNMHKMELQTFDLPFAFKPPYCQLKEPIRFLRAQDSACLFSTAAELQESTRSFIEVITKTKIVTKSKPEFVAPTSVADSFIDFDIKYCIMANNSEQCFLKIEEPYFTKIMTAENIYTTNIQIKFLHNYTNIIAGLVTLKLEPFDSKQAIRMELWQTYRVEFYYKNYTELLQEPKNDLFQYEVAAKAISGALGYQQGAPIIVAKFIACNKSQEMSETNRILNYFLPNTTTLRKNHALRLLTKKAELCYKNSNAENYINYGINALKQCTVRLFNKTIAATDKPNINFTIICMQLQETIWSQLYEGWNSSNEAMTELYVSRLGRPVNDTKKWTPLAIKNFEHMHIAAQHDEHTESFTCHNVVLSVAFEFFIATLTAQDVPQQNLVQHAELLVGPRHDLEFSVHELVEVPITVSVMFYDYTAKHVHNGAFVYFSLYLNVCCINVISWWYLYFN